MAWSGKRRRRRLKRLERAELAGLSVAEKIRRTDPVCRGLRMRIDEIDALLDEVIAKAREGDLSAELEAAIREAEALIKKDR